MPAYNSASFIGAAIESVISQVDVDFELIVVDDGSEDDTIEIVKRFRDPRIRVLENHRNRGIGYCHNQVLEQSRAPFIAHVDSDDVVLRPDALKKLLEKLLNSEIG